MRWLQLPHCVDGREPRSHRSLGLILVSARIAKVSEHAIAHVLGNVSFESRDRTRHRTLIAPQQFAHLLWIES